jgi:nitrate reductase NapE component
MPMLPMFGYIISGIIGAPFIVLGIYVMIAVRLNEGAMGFGVWMLCGGVLLVIGIPQVVIFFIEMEFIIDVTFRLTLFGTRYSSNKHRSLCMQRHYTANE